MSERTRWLSTRQAADLLGVKPQTVYAYVSRGVLRRHGGTDKRSSRFARVEVERLAARNRRGGRAGSLEVVIDTELTLLDPEGALHYRGRDAEELARTTSFERVAELLWDARHVAVWEVPDEVVRVGRRAQAALPKSADVIDRMRVVVAALGSTDPTRSDRRPEAVANVGRTAIAAAVDCLEERTAPAGTSIAQRLWSRLSDRPATRSEIKALNAALVLMADHELAASTLAARIAASAWADPYLVLSTGLAAGGGALHGAVSRSVEALLRSAPTPADAVAQVTEQLRAGERIPGFGHKVYVDHDPRAELVLDLVRRSGRRHSVDDTVAAIVDVMASHGKPAPNIDLGIAALAVKFGLPFGSGEVIFLLARMAGVIAHALEEYPHRLRFRPRALYTGRTAN